MADGKITAPDVIDAPAIERDIKRIDDQFKTLLETMKALTKEAGNFQSQRQGNQVLKNRAKVEEQTAAAIKERLRLENQLIRLNERNRQATSQVAQDVAKQRYETQKLNQQNKRSAILTSQYADAYDKLATRLAIAKRELKNLTIEQGANAEATKKQAAEVDKLDKKVRQADQSAGDFQRNVGNYRSGLAGLGNAFRDIVGAFGLYEGARMALTFAKDSVRIAREAKGIERAFDDIGEAGVKAFNDIQAASRGTLSALETKQAIVEFQNFNIDLEQAGTLFEFLTVRATQTGKSIEYLRDSLVEGLSKESKLRIDNLGISAAELNDELERTPSFVEAVANIAKKEIAEAGDIIDDAANSSNKFAASWENLSLNFGKIITNIPGVSKLADIIDGMGDSIRLTNEYFSDNVSYWDQLKGVYRVFTESGRETNAQLLEEIDNRKAATVEIKKQMAAYVAMHGSLAPFQQGQGPQGFSIFTQPEEQERQLKDINAELEKYNNELKEGFFSTREEAKAIQDKIAALEAERAAILGVREVQGQTFNDGTIAYYEQLIAEKEELARTTATNSEEYREYMEVIDQAKERITALKGEIESLNGVQKGFTGVDQTNEDGNVSNFAVGEAPSFILPEQSLEDFLKQEEQNEKDAVERTRKAWNEKVAIVRDSMRAFAQYYGVDIDAFATALEKKKRDTEDYFIEYGAAAVELNKFILNNALENYALEAEANRARLDQILNDDKASEEQKAVAKEKYRKQEAAIKKKEFEANKRAALIDIAINTAVGIARAWASPGFPGAIALTAVIAALGIAQASLVASKKAPEFFRGKTLGNPYEGPATWGEKREEVRVTKDGKVEVSPNRTTPTWVSKSDIITPSISDFKKQVQNPKSEIYKRLIKGHDVRRDLIIHREQQKNDPSVVRELKAMRQELAQLKNRPINVTAKVERDFTAY